MRRLLNVEKLVMMEEDVADGTHADAGGGMGAAMARKHGEWGEGGEESGENGEGDAVFFLPHAARACLVSSLAFTLKKNNPQRRLVSFCR